ncbi:hypothetical protein E4T44_01009 [Aureobasidium sp. EXF-8845]|nr:hypothetical protein E4T44_01009 [Aureobasidium sp. EXF-8845]KAI4857518.1 hypothetical protein E4T45_00987 [Aureobasidium sp. EXF-8846]
MMRVMIESHPSSKTPSAYVPVLERLDLTMPKSALQKPHKFTCAHLNYLECCGESIFANENSINLFMNVLRLHWKVSGNILRHGADQGNDLYELLILEFDGVFIIRDLLTVDAARQLLDRETSNAMMILATVVHDIYTAQWQNWSHEQNVKHNKNDQHALIISHAQAISNQLSNNVLAFRGKNAPELRKWAEMTVANHLTTIITPGHLPPVAPKTKHVWFFNQGFTRNFESVDPIISQVGSNNALEPGPVKKHDQARLNSIPPKHTAVDHDIGWHNSPSKRPEVKAQGPGRFRAFDSYRPSAYKGPASGNGQSGPKHPTFRDAYRRRNHRHSRDPLVTPSPIKHAIRHENQAPDTPTHEQLRKDKLRELELMIADHEYNAISHLDHTATGSKNNSTQEPDTPVVKGPSYTEYLRKKETDTTSPLTAIKVRTAGHIRTQSYIGSEEGEILE